MPTSSSPGPFTVGSKSFDPEALFQDDEKLKAAKVALANNNLRAAITTFFSLADDDNYVYHAVASVTLAQVQQAILQGDQHGLHDWYKDEEGKSIGHPPEPDITAYTSIFSPYKSAPNTLKSLAANAKRLSLRSRIAAHLTAHRSLHPSIPPVKPLKHLKPPTKQYQHQQHSNPALDFWTWSCHALQWAGPDASTPQLTTSHHVLPVFMHHFGCVVPSYEALDVIRHVAAGKPILDIGSGNGYWTFMLRRHLAATASAASGGKPRGSSASIGSAGIGTSSGSGGIGGDVIAVDSGQSAYRTQWISDTVIADGIQWLRGQRQGGTDDVLLLVYPIVGGDGFTERVIRAYSGDVVCVVGTQCRNGYTAFRDRVVDEWMDVEGDGEGEGGGGKGWDKVVQVPVPSFAGKDDALFVFQRKRRRKSEEGLG